MSKSSSKDIFYLIKSLSKSEKRYFKVFSSRHVIGDANNYVKLFDLIDKEKAYDESRIIKKKEYSKHFPKIKERLYALILKSLRAYNSDASVIMRLQSSLDNIDILYRKGLYEQCEKIIAKEKTIALKYEKHLHLAQLFHWEILIMSIIKFYNDTSESEVEKIYNDFFTAIDKFKNEKQYQQLNSRLYIKFKHTAVPRTLAELADFGAIMEHPLHLSEKNAITFQSLNYFYNNFTAYYGALGTHEKACYYAAKQLNLVEKNIHQLDNNSVPHTSAIHNLALFQIASKKYKEAADTIKKFDKIKANDNNIRYIIFIKKTFLSFELFVHSGQFEEGVKFFEKIKSGYFDYNEKELKPPDRILLTIFFAYVYFGAKNYTEAQKQMNSLLNDKTVDYRGDLYCFAKIFNLIIHYELGKKDLLEYTVKSCYRYLYSRNRLYKFETTVLEFLKNKAPIQNNKKNMITTFSALRDKLIDLSKDTYEKKALEYFDYISWLESKINDRSFAEIVKQKAQY
ncbi:MAG: hypothetical protein ACT4ON_00055 [Bacteroidota bacterium]